MDNYITILYNKIPSKSKYFTWYSQICQRAIIRATSRTNAKKLLGYAEGHHIVPKCICEQQEWVSDRKNIAFLTSREHYVCHWLLTKIFPNNYRLLYAFARMSVDYLQRRKLTSRQIERCRIANSRASALKPVWNLGLRYKSGPCSELRRTAIANARKNTTKIECQHCRKLVDPGNFKQFHGDNCKLNPDISPEILEQRSSRARRSMLTQKQSGTYSKPKPKHGLFTCPHCGKTGTNYGNMAKNHFTRCKVASSAAACSSDIESTRNRIS